MYVLLIRKTPLNTITEFLVFMYVFMYFIKVISWRNDWLAMLTGEFYIWGFILAQLFTCTHISTHR